MNKTLHCVHGGTLSSAAKHGCSVALSFPGGLKNIDGSTADQQADASNALHVFTFGESDTGPDEIKPIKVLRRRQAFCLPT